MSRICRAISFAVGLCVGLMVFATGVAPMPAAHASDPNRVALVVKHGDDVIKKCIKFSDDSISGLEVLEKSGLDLVYEGQSEGAFICRVDDEGCDFPEEACDCKFHKPDYLFWKYYHMDDGEWEFSQVGADSYDVEDGDVEGWIWASGTASGGGEKPPEYDFDDICTSSSSATSTPDGSDDDDDDELPTIDYFTADRTTVASGEGVTLSWDLHDADEAYIVVNGNEEGVIAPYAVVVNPTQTTTYRLVAENDRGDVDEEITITVSGVAASTATQAPTATTAPTAAVLVVEPTPVPQATVAENAAPAEPVPTDTPLPPMEWPTPVPELPTMTATPSGPPTPTWTPVPLATATPQEVAMASGVQLGGGGSGPLLREVGDVGSTGGPPILIAIVGGLVVLGGLGSLALVMLVARR